MLKTKQKKIFDLEPVDIDSYYKYVCPSCECSHWISHKEASTDEFKIVCDCDIVIIPKQIQNIQIVYKKESPQTSNQKDLELPDNIKDSAIMHLVKYGFNNQEALLMIDSAFRKSKSQEISVLIKLALKSTGINND